jgi:SAM-dependent methyltransferase
VNDGYGWESWEWDETLFEGAAPFYVTGRHPYAPGLPDAMAEVLDLDGTGRLLDVGCGPGVISLQLAHLFEGVVGLDPDRGMIAESEKRAAELGVTNATWVQMRAEELPGDLGSFRVVAFAASFHWMDRPKVAAAVRSMLDQVGCVVQIHAPAYIPSELEDGGTHPFPPRDAIVELRQRYLGPLQRAGRSFRTSSPSGENEIFQAAGFAPEQRVSVPDGRILERTVDELVAEVFSFSSTAPHLFGDRIGAFEADLRDLLAHVSPSGLFSVQLPDNRLSIWRPL